MEQEQRENINQFDHSKYFKHQLIPTDDQSDTPPKGGLNNLEMEEDKIVYDYELDRFPFCIVWTTIPFISWLIPIIGHTGICQYQFYDFAGPYFVSVDNFAFGRPRKIVKLDNRQFTNREWDNAVNQAGDEFRKLMHNLIINNCHNHVARVLNLIKYNGSSSYNTISIGWMCVFHSEYVDWLSVVKVYLPTFIIYGLIAMIIILAK